MARTRSIKPGFFHNDQLADLHPLTRILFAGLWTVADRDGRLYDRPRKIKAAVLPYDDCDIDAMLTDLQSQGFIVRYPDGDEPAIQIHNWSRHQNPHQKEPPSTINPPPPNGHGRGTRRVSDKSGTRTRQAPDKSETSTVQAPVEHESSPAGTLNPVPITGNPVPGNSDRNRDNPPVPPLPWEDGFSAPSGAAPEAPDDTPFGEDGKATTPLGICLDAMRAAGVDLAYNGKRDGKALKESSADPLDVAAVCVAVFRGEYGDDFMRKRLTIAEAVGWVNGFKASRTNVKPIRPRASQVGAHSPAPVEMTDEDRQAEAEVQRLIDGGMTRSQALDIVIGVDGRGRAS